MTEDWQHAMRHRDEQDHMLRSLVRELVMIVAILSAGHIAIGLGVGGWWAVCTGGLGLAGAAMLWREV